MHSRAVLHLLNIPGHFSQTLPPPLTVLAPVVDRSMVQHQDAELFHGVLPCETTLAGLVFSLLVSSDLGFIPSNSSWFCVFMIVITNLCVFLYSSLDPSTPFGFLINTTCIWFFLENKGHLFPLTSGKRWYTIILTCKHSDVVTTTVSEPKVWIFDIKFLQGWILGNYRTRAFFP